MPASEQRAAKSKKNKIPLSTKSNWSCSLTFRYVTNIFKGARKVNRHISAACHFLIPNLRYRKYETAAGVVNQTNIFVKILRQVVCWISKIKLRLRLDWSPSISLYIVGARLFFLTKNNNPFLQMKWHLSLCSKNHLKYLWGMVEESCKE